jgi:hypothetical protein
MRSWELHYATVSFQVLSSASSDLLTIALFRTAKNGLPAARLKNMTVTAFKKLNPTSPRMRAWHRRICKELTFPLVEEQRRRHIGR